MRLKHRIDVQIACEARGLPMRRSFLRWVALALDQGFQAADCTLRLVSSQEGSALNATYRGKTGPTNVLAFPGEAPALGDLILCRAVVETEARAQGKYCLHHWAHLVIHGVLHLLGHRHESADEAAQMEACERTLLQQLGYPDPYTDERGA